jgi:formate dehydrogenase iron-sulfur subunit
MAEKMSVLYDATKCTACQACSVACKQWNSLPAEKTKLTGSYQTHQEFTPQTWTFITFHEVFENNKNQWFFRKKQCMHCDDAACQKSCNFGAISHTDQGFVVIDHNKCVGCGYCVTNCTFHVPRVNPATNKAYKCTGCPDRVVNGMAPACVQTCQPEALVFGPRDKILAQAKRRFEQIKPLYPKANLYDAPNLNGINFTYILQREPEFYGLPPNPHVPYSINVWKNFVTPFGALAIAGSLFMTAVSYVKTRNYKDHSEPDTHADDAKNSDDSSRGGDSNG